MPPHSQFESLPAELLSGILTRCSREDLVNLAQTHSTLRAVCRKELANYPLTMKLTSGNLKSWVAYFRKENTLLTQGARSLDITIAMTMQDLLDAFDDIDPTVFDISARPIHPDAGRILPLPSSLRKLSLKLGWIPGPSISSDVFLFLLLRPLPEQCPHLDELSIQASPRYLPHEFGKRIRRLNRPRSPHLNAGKLPNISNHLLLLLASLTDLNFRMTDIQIQEEVATTVTCMHGIRKLSFERCEPQGIANILMILSRGGATHLTKLILRENRSETDLATIMPLREALTVGLKEFSLLQPPLRTLGLARPSAWSDSLHLPLLHTAVASTLTQLYLRDVESCIFTSHLLWPCLQSLELIRIPKTGYQGPLTKPIFPVLTTLTMLEVGEIQASEDLFPALETIKWQDVPTPELVASLIRHGIKRIDMVAYYADDAYRPLWEAMGGHTIDLIALEGRFPDRVRRLANNGERIFPGFPNIREFTIE